MLYHPTVSAVRNGELVTITISVEVKDNEGIRIDSSEIDPSNPDVWLVVCDVVSGSGGTVTVEDEQPMAANVTKVKTEVKKDGEIVSEQVDSIG